MSLGRKRLRRQTGARVILAADELYLAAERNIPNYTAEEREAQIENGVGMVSSLGGMESAKKQAAPCLARKTRVAVLTGVQSSCVRAYGAKARANQGA